MIEANRFQIRWMISSDLPEVADISFHSTEYPKSVEEIKTLLRQRNNIGTVLLDKEDDIVLGYMIYDIEDKQECKIIDLAVHPRYLRQGFGSMLVDKQARKCGPKGTRLSVIVNERNLGALLFFKRYGFLAERGVIRRHFGSQDGIPMVLDMARVTELLTKREQIVATGYLRS